MKVLQINAVCNESSTGRNVKESSRFLSNAGVQTLIATSVSDSSEGVYLIGTKLEKKIHAFFSRLFGKQAYYSNRGTSKLLKWIKKQKPNIVHLHNLHANYIHLNKLLDFLAQNDIPTVITLHDCWFFTGKCTHYATVKCFKWETRCYDCPKLKEDHNSWFFDRTKKIWEDRKKRFLAIPRLAVVGVSDWITNEAKKSPMFKNAKSISRIYNWVDLEIFKPKKTDIVAKYNLPKNKFFILCISAGWEEGSDRFKNLISLSKFIDESMHILLVGKVGVSVDIPPNITPIGYIKNLDELAEVYSGADAYVHLSYEDTFGKVIAESLACGTPAVVYNSTACPELISNGCGMSVDIGNTEKMHQCLQQIKNKGKLHYQQVCRNRAEQLFSLNSSCAEYLNIYNNLQKE